MIIALGVDHAGFGYKAPIRQEIEALGHTVLDLGTDDETAVDYPQIAVRVARAVREGRADLGVFLCGTGIGGSIAANKVRGIRAALCHESFTARMSRLHNNANLLCMGARVIGLSLAQEIVRTWLTTPWSNETRHAARVAQLHSLEGTQASEA
jgi:ribose 5-phosphate isomerase B